MASTSAHPLLSRTDDEDEDISIVHEEIHRRSRRYFDGSSYGQESSNGPTSSHPSLYPSSSGQSSRKSKRTTAGFTGPSTSSTPAAKQVPPTTASGRGNSANNSGSPQIPGKRNFSSLFHSFCPSDIFLIRRTRLASICCLVWKSANHIKIICGRPSSGLDSILAFRPLPEFSNSYFSRV